LLLHPTLYGIFPNVMWYNHHGKRNYDFRHRIHAYNVKNYDAILDFLNITQEFKVFSEGNCFICSKHVVYCLFNNNYELFYNLLNYDNSFDLNWFTIYYNLQNISLLDAYTSYCVDNKYGNNIPIMHMPETIADGMIEHVFERIWLTIIKHLGGDFLVLGNDAINDDIMKYKNVFCIDS